MNADGILGSNQDILSYNLYVYCSNNPVNYSDPTGKWKLWDRIKSSVSDFFRSFKSDYCSMATKATAASIVTGKNIPFGNGWTIRVDKANEDTHTKKHLHVEKGKLKYAQNEDGSKHDGGSTKGSPPNSIKKKLKKEIEWDWDEKSLQCAMNKGIDMTQSPMYQVCITPIDFGSYASPAFQPIMFPMMQAFA